MSLWDNAVEASRGLGTQEDFEAAAYRLLAEQVIYASDRGNKLAYALIEDFEKEFRRALEPLGVGLLVNPRFRYACALPRHTKVSGATVDQTLLALVLRKIYDEVARLGQQSDQGEVFVDLVDLEVKFRQATNGRDLPRGGELRSLVRTLQRWGLARQQDEMDGALALADGALEQPFAIVIRPAIVEVLGEAAIHKLALFSSDAPPAPSTDEGEQVTEEDA